MIDRNRVMSLAGATALLASGLVGVTGREVRVVDDTDDIDLLTDHSPPGSARNRPSGNQPVPGGGKKEAARRLARMEAQREKLMRALYRAHRLHCDAPLGDQDDTIPTTRTDLRDLYAAILDRQLETPDWAVSIIKGY